MRPPILVFTFVVASLGGTAHAQKLYQCGKTFSQTPCAIDAAERRLHTMGASDPALPAPKLKGFDLCAAAAAKATGTLEPESARAQARAPRKMEVIQYAGAALPAQRYELEVTAKNENGMYALTRAVTCWVSEDQSRILQFSPG